MLEYSPNHLDHLIRSLYENKSCRTHRPMILTSKEEKGQLDHVPSFRNAVMVPSSPSWKLRIHQNCDAVLWSASSSLASLSRPLQSQAWIFPLPAATKKNWQQNLQSWRKPKSEIDIGWMVGWIRLLCFPVEHHNLELIPCHSLVAVNWLIHSSFPGTRLCESTSRMTDMFPKVRVPVCNCHIQPKERSWKFQQIWSWKNRLTYLAWWWHWVMSFQTFLQFHHHWPKCSLTSISEKRPCNQLLHSEKVHEIIFDSSRLGMAWARSFCSWLLSHVVTTWKARGICEWIRTSELHVATAEPPKKTVGTVCPWHHPSINGSKCPWIRVIRHKIADPVGFPWFSYVKKGEEISWPRVKGFQHFHSRWHRG